MSTHRRPKYYDAASHVPSLPLSWAKVVELRFPTILLLNGPSNLFLGVIMPTTVLNYPHLQSEFDQPVHYA
ncbi:hypothetical protein VP1G_10796 [Cytospora mali]|uniref:Uncharacterized protein n=1 Tax=Cytospora mali TaxID=578113 RepID=A0A194UWM5_CYTMA|nr:hypothetical protein VP1G_10796 [Valsa mali var. pyri (nom. inval.)]